MIRVIVNCIYTPTGKREDLWETCVKTPRAETLTNLQVY